LLEHAEAFFSAIHSTLLSEPGRFDVTWENNMPTKKPPPAQKPRDLTLLRAKPEFQHLTHDDVQQAAAYLEARIQAEIFDDLPDDQPIAVELDRLTTNYFHGLYYEPERTRAYERKGPIEEEAYRSAGGTLDEFKQNVDMIKGLRPGKNES
jgi:hypothetical protein